MVSVRTWSVLTGVVILTSVVAAEAQVRPARAVPQPVSPGAERRPALAAGCPGFTWAPIDGAHGYELAVHEWLEPGQLSETPVMRTVLPGRSAGWAPAASDCLPAGRTYLWFLRELGVEGEAIGAWSPGLAFHVAAPAAAAPAGETSSPGREVTVAAKPGETPPDNANGNPPPSVQDQLATINAKLDDLLSPVSFDVCVELGAEAEIHGEFGGDFDGEFEGRVGAEGFGNGVMGKVKAKPGWGFGAQVKGALVPKVAFCFDLLSLPAFEGSAATARTTRMAAISSAATLDADALTDRLLTLVESLDLNGERLTRAMEILPELGGGIDPWSAFRSDGPVVRLAEVMPLPGNLGETLKDPAQLIDHFRSQLALCSNGNLPPAIAGVVNEFCGLANNERFAKLLDRVDGTVTNVKGTIDNVRNKIDDILGQLPTSGDCKFFCKD